MFFKKIIIFHNYSLFLEIAILQLKIVTLFLIIMVTVSHNYDFILHNCIYVITLYFAQL